jgi:hypothetical protein
MYDNLRSTFTGGLIEALIKRLRLVLLGVSNISELSENGCMTTTMRSESIRCKELRWSLV